MKLWTFVSREGEEYEFDYDEVSNTCRAIGPIPQSGSAPVVFEEYAETEEEAVEKLRNALGGDGELEPKLTIDNRSKR